MSARRKNPLGGPPAAAKEKQRLYVNHPDDRRAGHAAQGRGKEAARREPAESRQVLSVPIRKTPASRGGPLHRSATKAIFSLGPSTARSLFVKNKKRMGGGMDQPAFWLDSASNGTRLPGGRLPPLHSSKESPLLGADNFPSNGAPICSAGRSMHRRQLRRICAPSIWRFFRAVDNRPYIPRRGSAPWEPFRLNILGRRSLPAARV